VYIRGLRDEQQAEVIVRKSAGERIVRYIGDPSMFNNRTEQDKPSIATIYKKHGIRLEPGVNSRIPGWQAVRRALASDNGHRPRLQVMRERCPNLIRTFPAMVHDPLDAEDLADKIGHAKTEDHALDALRYGLVAEEGLNQARALAQMAGSTQQIVRTHRADAEGERARYLREMMGRG
jgi:hypothetical protein